MESMIDFLKESNSDKQSVHRYGFIYDLLLARLALHRKDNLKVLEIGVSEFGDGSFRAWSESEKVSRVIGIDTEPYLGETTDKMEFYLLDAYSKASVHFLEEVEGSDFDLIVHDGSAVWEQQAFFFEHYGLLLRENGFLVCEDVSALSLINEYLEDASVFCIDGWANRGVQVNSFNADQNFYGHHERLLIKAKSEEIKAAKVHESKPHIAKLPDIQIGSFDRTSTNLAISIPLFHSELPNWNASKFQEVHCKGAIWAGISLLRNTDLAENGVPLFFHVEEKVWDAAFPVFQRFGVPESWCRRMDAPIEKPQMQIKKPAFGKSFMALLDSEIDPDVLMIADSDLFTCVTGEPLQLYKKLTIPILKHQPSMMYFKSRELPYAWYVSILLLASGISDALIKTCPLPELEQQAYERLGLEKEVDSEMKFGDMVQGFYAEDYFMTFPRGHETRDYAISRMSECYATPYIFAAWAEFNYPFLDLSDILGVPIYDWESNYIQAEQGDDCFAHFRVDKCSHPSMTQPSRIREYWDRFLENVSRHVNGS